MAENNNGTGDNRVVHTAWISRGFEWLENKVHDKPGERHFDVLIVGSGYGGAIAADTFARCRSKDGPISVGILERGNEYLSGAFPAGLHELPRHIRQKGVKEGLFDIRLGPEVTTVVANGVGGGSLINAGVMEVPAENVFAKGWPTGLSTLQEWRGYFDEAGRRLGSRDDKRANTILGDPSKNPDVPKKYGALKAIAPNPDRFRAAAITVAIDDMISSGNVALPACSRCGDCATGCNFGAKNSLDVNLLVRAKHSGAQIFSGATVLRIEHEESGDWLVHCVHTNAKLRERSNTVSKIRASKVILAAGTLGSTEILLRSKQAGLPLSEKLGRRCSTNGDMLIAKYATNGEVNTVANETEKPSERRIGPTITGIIDLRTPEGGVVIEEMSVPAGLRRAFGEVFATVNTLHALNERDSSLHSDGFATDDGYRVSDERIARSALYAVMGDDGAAGEIELVGEDPTDDGVGRIRWPELPDHPLFERQVEALAELAKKTGGRLVPNPIWKLLPADLAWLLQDKRGPLTTVHPLGGCAMADSVADGVVDDCGQVFDASADRRLHEGLVVLDGSIIPTALGINPALTIAAVALRAAEQLASKWEYDLAQPAAPDTQRPLRRPALRSTDRAFEPAATEVEVIERLVGPVTFRCEGQSAPKKRVVEITLRFAPKAVATLYEPSRRDHEPVLTVSEDESDEIRSRIRIFDHALWSEMEKKWTPALSFERELEALALFSAPLTGTLRVFARTKSYSLVRVLRAGWAWLLNRGMRDVFQAIADRNKKGVKEKGSGFWARLIGGIAVASRGGEIRVFDYALEVGAPDSGAVLTLDGTRIEGRKRFTYNRRASPWRQLMEVELEKFPGLERASHERVLTLDLRYLARIGVPLFRIVKQHDGATALAELASFFGYVLRLLIGIHIWSFRKPDEDYSGRKPNRMPSTILEGLPEAKIHEAPLAPETPAGAAAAGDTSGRRYDGKVILTRFANAQSTKPPLLMLHGYSASGTTFAHHSVRDNFASSFWKSGRDVWIADLRTSSGQEETAKLPWSFEQIGTKDIPAAFAKILEVRNGERQPAAQPAPQPAADAADAASEKIDVIAHCMGTVVFSMAVLGGTKVADQVGRAAFTQVGPLVVFSPVNIFRAYVLRYLIDFLPDNYSFRPDQPSLADDLFDRLLSTLPYPAEEFDIENPLKPWARTPWTRTRHRMDALYGRDFNVANMEPEMLRHIDDHFGPLSLRTVAQTLHFVRYSMITTFGGDNNFVEREMLAKKWTFPTFSVHGAANGLAHVSTVDRMRVIFEDAGRDYRTPHVIENAGHQDALVGNKRAEAIAKIKGFLDGETDGQVQKPKSTEMVAYPPWIGPIITEVRPTFVLAMPAGLENAPALVIRLGTAPTHHSVEGVVMIRVQTDGERAARPDGLAWDEGYVLDHMAFYGSQKLRDRWDALFAPRPELMPGGPQGDALLVLIVYSDSVLLAPDVGREHAYFRLKPGTESTEEFWPLVDIDSDRDFERAVLEFAVFQRAARALLKALLAQAPAEARRDAARSRPGHPVLLAAPPGVSIELPIAKVDDLPPLPSTAQLLFGVNDAEGKPRAAGALEHDPGVADGVIPYQSPQQPTAGPHETRFALMSCQYPAGLLDEPAAQASYRRVLERERVPKFLILTGDQVYVDPTAGLYDPSAKDDKRLRRPYELWLRQPTVRKALRSKPSFMLLDDHEIGDNWEPLPPQSQHENANDRARLTGVAAYNKFQRAELLGIEAQTIGSSQSFYFNYDGFPFFMLDTRTARKRRRAGEKLDEATLFDGATFEALENWLADKAYTGPRFVVTPAMLLPRHANTARRIADDMLDAQNLNALRSDGWDGYPSTLTAVLGLIAKSQIEHVVFLSGDEHRGCVAEIDLYDAARTKAPVRVHSLHATAAYAPYPFANSLASDFVPNETIRFKHGNVDYKCSVTAKLIDSRDGALLVGVGRDRDGAWVLEYEYADGIACTLPLKRPADSPVDVT